MRFEEEFTLILRANGLKIYDTRHAVKEWKKWFPSLSIEALRKALQQATSKKLAVGNYMVISKKHGFRIPLEIRRDRKSPNLIGVVPTVLSSTEVINLRDELEIVVENAYNRRQLIEGFNYYVQHGVIFSDFEEIDI